MDLGSDQQNRNKLQSDHIPWTPPSREKLKAVKRKRSTLPRTTCSCDLMVKISSYFINLSKKYHIFHKKTKTWCVHYLPPQLTSDGTDMILAKRVKQICAKFHINEYIVESFFRCFLGNLIFFQPSLSKSHPVFSKGSSPGRHLGFLTVRCD